MTARAMHNAGVDAAALQDRLARWRRLALGIGGLAALLAVVGYVMSPEQFFRSYLTAYLFWIALPLGAFGFVCLQHMTGGGWGLAVRRILESAAATMPLMLLLFLPLVFGIDMLYPWARPEEVAADPLLQHKAPYLNVPFFLARTAGYFALWLAGITLLNRFSRRQDAEGAAAVSRPMQLLSGAGLPLYGLTVTFAAIDWAMTLEPHWFSTIYGMMFVAGQGLATLAFAIVALRLLYDLSPLREVVRRQNFHDLGNLQLAFVMLWAYMSYSQYLIIWSGNLPEEITWYLHRGEGGWELVGMALIVLHFAIPFLVLLSRRSKRSPAILAAVSLGILALRYIDIFWLTVPAFSPGRLTAHWLDLALLVAIGGFWVAFLTTRLGSWPLIPVNDARLAEAAEGTHDENDLFVAGAAGATGGEA